MVHNLTQSLLDIISGLGSLGKTKVSTLANAIVDVMDEENDLRSIVVNENMRKALVAMLFRENASADIIGATLVSSTVALLYIQELGNLNIDSALLGKIIKIVYSKLSVNEEDIKALLTQVNIDIALVKSIREVAIAPKAGQEFAAQLVFDGVDLSTLTNIQQKFVVENILKIYAQQLKLDLSKFAIVVSLNKSNSSVVRKAPMVSREVSITGQSNTVFDVVAGVDLGAAGVRVDLGAAGVADAGVAVAFYAGVVLELDGGATATAGFGVSDDGVVAYTTVERGADFELDAGDAGAGAGAGVVVDAGAGAELAAELDAGADELEREFRSGVIPGNYNVSFSDSTIATYTPLDFAMTNDSFDGAAIKVSVVDTYAQFKAGVYDYSQELTITASIDGAEVENSRISLAYNPDTKTWQQRKVDENGNIVDGNFMSTDHYSYGMRPQEWTIAQDGSADNSYSVNIGWNFDEGYEHQGFVINSNESYLTGVMGYSEDEVRRWMGIEMTF